MPPSPPRYPGNLVDSHPLFDPVKLAESIQSSLISPGPVAEDVHPGLPTPEGLVSVDIWVVLDRNPHIDLVRERVNETSFADFITAYYARKVTMVGTPQFISPGGITYSPPPLPPAAPPRAPPSAPP